MTRVRPLTAIVVSQVTLFNRHANGALQSLRLGAPAVHTSMRGLCVTPSWYVPTYTFTHTHPLRDVASSACRLARALALSLNRGRVLPRR